MYSNKNVLDYLFITMVTAKEFVQCLKGKCNHSDLELTQAGMLNQEMDFYLHEIWFVKNVCET